MPAQPDAWERDELVLALDIYLRYWNNPDLDRQVLRLSQELNRLPIHPKENRPDNFRSPDAVAMKVAEFTGFDSTKTSAGRGKSQAAVDVWAEFGRNVSKVRNEAARIRERYAASPDAGS